MDTQAIPVEPIGYVSTKEQDVSRQDWTRVRSEIRLREGLGAALLGLEDYSHVIVVAWLDRIPGELRTRLQAYPAGDERLPLQGALALRGGARPNPIAVTVCRLRVVKGDMLSLDGLDLVDGTPILDVKPYIAYYDSIPDAKLPRWAEG